MVCPTPFANPDEPSLPRSRRRSNADDASLHLWLMMRTAGSLAGGRIQGRALSGEQIPLIRSAVFSDDVRY
tara:strand:+ start:931 stop:1143 length:213 start_codon:yes stop_codon:yes gene_type:complete